MESKPPIAVELWNRIPTFIQTVLLTLISRLFEQIAYLKETIKAQNAKIEELNKNSTNSSLPPSKDKPNVKRAKPKNNKRKRKKGAQKGHEKHQRPLVPTDQVNEIIPCKPTDCENCAATLEGDDPNFERHQTFEIPPIVPHVTEYQIHTLPCKCCGHHNKGSLPDGVGPGHFGPYLVSMISLFTGVCRLSKRMIQRLLQEVFNLQISIGQICRLQAKMADALDPCVAEAKNYIRTQHTNIDETGWKQRAKRCWLWVAVSRLVVLILIRPSRGAKVLEEILGPEYTKIVTSDRAKAYDTLPLELRQLCWAHLDRDFQAMIDRENCGSAVGMRLSKDTDQLFEWWQKVRDGTWTRKTFQHRLYKLREEFLSAFEFGSQCGCPKTAATCRELLQRESALWTFAYVEGVEPTNNEGEREARHPVTYRKICFGTDSEQGSKFIGNIMTVSASLRRQGRNVMEFLVASYKAFCQDTAPPSILPEEDIPI